MSPLHTQSWIAQLPLRMYPLHKAGEKELKFGTGLGHSGSKMMQYGVTHIYWKLSAFTHTWAHQAESLFTMIPRFSFSVQAPNSSHFLSTKGGILFRHVQYTSISHSIGTMTIPWGVFFVRKSCVQRCLNTTASVTCRMPIMRWKRTLGCKGRLLVFRSAVFMGARCWCTSWNFSCCSRRCLSCCRGPHSFLVVPVLITLRRSSPSWWWSLLPEFRVPVSATLPNRAHDPVLEYAVSDRPTSSVSRIF